MLKLALFSDVALSRVTIFWIILPFFTAFSIYLLPRWARWLALGITMLSGLYVWLTWQFPEAVQFNFVDSFGVTLQIDHLTSYFVLTNAVVSAAVILYCWQKNQNSFFYIQVMALHGSVNSVFICADFISFYVALEVISVAAFLLITYPRSDRNLWVGLRYLFISNTAMLFYLLGAALVYQSTRSFALVNLAAAPPEATALIFLGLLTKGGIFVSGLWLPLTHAEADTPVSAMLSGVVIKAGVFPLVRSAQLVPSVEPLLLMFGVGTSLLGVSYAILATDTKRTLAASTISQLGFVVASPAAAGGYALCHGLAKSALFLIAGNLPSRQFEVLRRTPLPLSIWGPLAIASLSIAGCPLVAGYGAKTATLKAVEGWPGLLLNLAALGTAIAFAKFLLLPVCGSSTASTQGPVISKPALGLLAASLILANGFFLPFYQLQPALKALGIVLLGVCISVAVAQKLKCQFPLAIERLEHLIGGMSLVLTLLFWLVAI